MLLIFQLTYLKIVPSLDKVTIIIIKSPLASKIFQTKSQSSFYTLRLMVIGLSSSYYVLLILISPSRYYNITKEKLFEEESQGLPQYKL